MVGWVEAAARAWRALVTWGERQPPVPFRVQPAGLIEVVGAAGSGKTRCLLEWARRLSAGGGRILWLDCDRTLELGQLTAMAPGTWVVVRPACPVAALELGCRALAAKLAQAVVLDSLAPLGDCCQAGYDHDLCELAGWRPEAGEHAVGHLARRWRRANALSRRLNAGIWVAAGVPGTAGLAGAAGRVVASSGGDSLFGDPRPHGPQFGRRPAGRRTSAIPGNGCDPTPGP